MGRLRYVTNASLDGYLEDRDGGFDFGPLDDELHSFCAEVVAAAGTLLYGRRLYETMAVWETDPSLAQASPLTAEFADAWRRPRKVVWSRSLPAPLTTDTSIEREFDAESVRRLKAEDGDLLVGGAELAAQALAAGLVDECLVFVWPVVVGGGKPALPTDGRYPLELLEQRVFANGVVLLRYAVRCG